MSVGDNEVVSDDGINNETLDNLITHTYILSMMPDLNNKTCLIICNPGNDVIHDFRNILTDLTIPHSEEADTHQLLIQSDFIPLINQLNLYSWKTNKQLMYAFPYIKDEHNTFDHLIRSYFDYITNNNDYELLACLLKMFRANPNAFMNEACNIPCIHFMQTLIQHGAFVTKQHLKNVLEHRHMEVVHFLLDNYFQNFYIKSSDHTLAIVRKEKTYPAAEHKAAITLQSKWRRWHRATSISHLLFAKPCNTSRNFPVYPRHDELKKILFDYYAGRIATRTTISLLKETFHYAKPSSLSKIIHTGAILSTNFMATEEIARGTGISDIEDNERKDTGLACTAPHSVDLRLSRKFYINLDLEKIAKIPLLNRRVYFKFCDWARLSERDGRIKITDTIHLREEGVFSIHEMNYAFYKDDTLIASCSLSGDQEIYHGIDGLEHYIFMHVFKIITAANNKALEKEIYDYFLTLHNKQLLMPHLNEIAEKIISRCELDFENSLPLSFDYIKEINLGSDVVLRIDVLVENISTGNLAALAQVFKQLPDIKQYEFVMNEIVRYLKKSLSDHIITRDDVISHLKGVSDETLEKMDFSKRQIDRQQASSSNELSDHLIITHIKNMIAFMIRASKDEYGDMPFDVNYNSGEKTLCIMLILDKDVRSKNKLQYDAERLLLQALGIFDKLDYHPDRIYEEDTLTFKYRLGDDTCELSSSIKTIQPFNNLHDVLAALLKNTCTLAIAGEAFCNELLDPRDVIRPSAKQVGVDAPATTYLNAHPLLEDLYTGDIHVCADATTTKITTKIPDLLSLGLLQKAFQLDSACKIELMMSGCYMMIIDTHYLIQQICHTANNYLGISLITEDGEEVCLLERVHPHLLQTLHFDFSAGGSAPFPHNLLASIVAILQWKLGIDRGKLMHLFTSEQVQICKKEDDFLSVIVPLPRAIFAELQDEKNNIHSQFYKRKSVTLFPLHVLKTSSTLLNKHTSNQFNNVFNCKANSIAQLLNQHPRFCAYGKFTVKIPTVDRHTGQPNDNFANIRIIPLNKSIELTALLSDLTHELGINEQQISIQRAAIVIKEMSFFSLESKLREKLNPSKRRSTS